MRGENLKLTCYENYNCEVGISDRITVSLCELLNGSTVTDCFSPSDLYGRGGCFDDALEDYLEQLEDYIQTLIRFKEEIIETPRCYDEVVEVDYANNLIKGDCNGS